MTVAVITDGVETVEGTVIDGRVLVGARELETATGWRLEPEGLCRGDVCVLVPDGAAVRVDDRVDLGALAEVLGRRHVVDAEAGVIAWSLDGEARRQALDDLTAPSFTLPDLDGRPRSLEEWRGRRRMLFAFSSW